ncbi:MAG TPA: DUF5916 domain-containing protein [Pyrinomonadaceae bacterium]|nr:DUF5916 domain-containing protein [Pyrinomonadaceae bacterium]
MKNLGLILVVFLFSAFTSTAQFQTTAETASTKSPASGAAPRTGGKVEIPAEKKAAINIPKAIAAPVIDGNLDDEVWKSAAVFKDFYQTGPGYNTEPSKPTEVYMTYDALNLYVAFKCWDDKDKIRASVANRDNVYGEDNVRIWLDTYNDQRRAYVIGFNPLGIQQDGIYTEGQGADFSVDIVMESKGAIHDWGWAVEVKIPFKSIRYTAGKGKMWGFNVARNIDRFNDEFDQWLPDDRDVSGFLIKNGHITGLDEIKYERTLQIVPSVTLSESGERVSDRLVPAGRFVNHQLKKDIGVNIKYTISPNVTLDAAINPDYAEIEADAPVVSANQRFPIYFQEKRPFFLESKEIFDSPLIVFYSRNIVDPDVALKVTGKINKTSFGILAASDNAPGNFSEDERTRNEQCKERLRLGLSTRPCPNDEFIDKNAYFGIVRLKRDFGSNNYVGFYGTARVFPQRRNFTAGLDGSIKFNSATVMKWQALETHTRKNFFDPATGTSSYRNGDGIGYFWSLDYTKDTHGWYAEIFGRSKDYVADSGFTRRTNTNQAFFAYRESTKSKPKAAVIRWDFNQFVRYTFDWHGRIQYGLLGGSLNAQLQKQLYLNLESGYQFEKNYEEDGFGLKRNPVTGLGGAFYGAATRSAGAPYLSWNINKAFNKKFNLYNYGFIAWSSFDYDFGGGNRFPRVSPAALLLGQGAPLDPGAGTQYNVGGGFTYKPINPLTTSLDYTKDTIRRHDTGLTAYDANIFTWRTTYQFTRFTYARVRWDYDTLSSSAAGQFLLGWNPNPGTAFYVGYNDSLNYNGFNPYTTDPTGANLLEPGFKRNGRTFFIRASYLFRRSF